MLFAIEVTVLSHFETLLSETQEDALDKGMVSVMCYFSQYLLKLLCGIFFVGWGGGSLVVLEVFFMVRAELETQPHGLSFIISGSCIDLLDRNL